MNELTTVGIDLAKEVIAACVLDEHGAVVEGRVFRRDAFERWAAALPPCAVAMEERTGSDRARCQGLQERSPLWRLAGPHASATQLRRQDALGTDQLARQRLLAHASDARGPKHIAVSPEGRAVARQPAAALDHRAARSRRLLQDIDRDRQQARAHALGNARQG
jgi:hypothetical protein